MLLGGFDVFVSHARDVEEFAQRLASRLRGAKRRVFIDKNQLIDGRPYDSQLKNGIERCGVFIFVLSPGSLRPSAYSQTELGWAVQSGRKLLCVHAPGYEQLSPPPALDALTYVSTTGDRIAAALDAVQRMLNTPRQSAMRLVVAVLAVLLIGSVSLAAWRTYAAEPAFFGSVYDTNNKPLQGVAVMFVGGGTARMCPSVETDEQGGFVFESCATAKHIQRPRAILEVPGRPPCGEDVELLQPPRPTVVRIDPEVSSCTPAPPELIGVPPAELGGALFTSYGCGTCHPPRGGNSIGGSLAGLLGSEVRLTDGSTILANRFYIRESIVAPQSKMVAGYVPRMPPFTLSEERLEALVDYVSGLK